jgi:hypothetical protein
MIIDLAKTARTQCPAKIVEHTRIGNRKPIGQMRKATPLLLLAQAPNKRIEAERAGEQNQHVNTPELSGAEAQATTLATLTRKALVDEIIWNMRRENPQKF